METARVKNILISKWYVFVLIIVFILAFYLRYIPARFPEIHDLDSTYFFRAGLQAMNNGLALPEKDMMREYPIGSYWDFPAPIFFPALMYAILKPVLNTTYLNFVLLYSPLMGALAVIAIYFVGRELYDRKAGVIAAFFAAVFPATISRTTSGFFEKEAISGIALPASVYFFIKAYKTGSWKCGALSGVFLAFFALTTTMAQYLYFLYALFALIVLLLDRYSPNLAKSYIPSALIGIMPSFLIPFNFVKIRLDHPGIMLLLFVMFLLAARGGAEKISIIKKEHIRFLIPTIVVLVGLGLLVTSTFLDFSYELFQKFYRSVFFDVGVTMSTVAENNPGSWGEVVRSVGIETTIGMVPQLQSLSFLFSAWFFIFIGILLGAYRILKSREFFVLFYVLWIVSGIWSIFGMVRLMFLLGPPTAVMAGYALSYIIERAGTYNLKVNVKKPETILFGIGGILLVLVPTVLNNIILLFVFSLGGVVFLGLGLLIKKSYSELLQKILNFITRGREPKNMLLFIPVVLVMLLIISLNTAAGYFYSISMGPMMNQYWYEAMDFLANKTPEKSNILSWWDFGYIFQHYGKRPSVSDGGWGPRDEVADWFVSPPENWTNWEWYIKGKYHVDYILMDYTLPGKYGAISKIAYRGRQVLGIPQFANSGVQPQGNKTIYEFSAGPYVIWIPFDSSGMRITGTPMFLIKQGENFVSKAYINELCTESGIVKIGDEQNAVGGCITFTKYGLFFVPEEVKNTIFSSLMFMDGWNLPVKKVFDNGMIKIYEVLYEGNSTASIAS